MLCPLNGNLGNFHYLTKDSTVDSHVCSVGLLSVFVKGLFLGPPFRNSTQLHVSVSADKIVAVSVVRISHGSD